MSKYRRLLVILASGAIFVACGTVFVACGPSKNSVGGRVPVPEFGKPEKPVADKQTLTLKAESLKLTPIAQVWKTNSLTQEVVAEKYLKLQKKFAFPIQFNGWVILDHVEHNYLQCAQAASNEPSFILEDDHNGAILMRPGEKIPVNLEKLYIVRLEFANISLCKDIDIQFGVLYGTNE